MGTPHTPAGDFVSCTSVFHPLGGLRCTETGGGTMWVNHILVPSALLFGNKRGWVMF